MSRFRAAFDAAFRVPAVRVEPVRLPVRETSDYAVLRRSVKAGETAVTLAPISVLKPETDTDESVQQFVVEQFTEAQKKRRRTRAA